MNKPIFLQLKQILYYGFILALLRYDCLNKDGRVKREIYVLGNLETEMYLLHEDGDDD